MKNLGIFLSTEPNRGGVFQYTLSLLKALKDVSGEEYEVIAFYRDEVWLDICNNLNIRSYKTSANTFLRGITLVMKLFIPIKIRRCINKYVNPLGIALRKSKIDFCIYPAHEHFIYEIGIHSIATIHDLMHRYERRFPEVSANGIFLAREKRFCSMCKWADAILTDSEVGLRQVRESYGQYNPKIFALPYIAPDYVYDDEMEINDEIINLQHTLPAKYIFYPAQFWQHKNHINLIKAISSLIEMHPEIALVLVGSKKNGYEKVEEYIKEYGLGNRVIILGYVSNNAMIYLYKHARALVMPTFFGPTNIPQLEAFHLGCPVSTSNIYGIPDQVGDAALLFDPNSVDEIAECIDRLWTDDELCKVLIEKGKQQSENWGQKQFNKRLKLIISSIAK